MYLCGWSRAQSLTWFSVHVVNHQLVGDLLLERAADTNPQVVKKTLHVLEAVAATTGLDGIVSHIRGRAGVLAQVAASTDKPSVRSHVTKVMHLYGAGGAAPAVTARASCCLVLVLLSTHFSYLIPCL